MHACVMGALCVTISYMALGRSMRKMLKQAARVSAVSNPE